MHHARHTHHSTSHSPPTQPGPPPHVRWGDPPPSPAHDRATHNLPPPPAANQGPADRVFRKGGQELGRRNPTPLPPPTPQHPS